VSDGPLIMRFSLEGIRRHTVLRKKFGCWTGPFLVKGTRLRKVWTKISPESIAP